MDLSVILNYVIVACLGIFFFLIWILIVPTDIVSALKNTNKKKQEKVGNNLDIEQAINVIIENSINSLEDKYLLETRQRELTNKKLPLKIRMLKMVQDTINNPYASLSYLQIGFAIIFSIIASTISYILFVNPVVSFVFIVLFIVAPFIFTQVKSRFVQINYQNDNFIFSNTFYLNFLKNKDFEVSLQQAMKSMSVGSRNYRLADTFLKTKKSLGLLLPAAVEELKLAMRAGIYETSFFAICLRAVDEDEHYKKALHPIILQMQDEAKTNATHLKGCALFITLYVISICLLIFGIVRYKYSNVDLYEKILSPVGQLAIFALFVIIGSFLPTLLKHLKPIKLKPYAVIEKYRKGDISDDI